MINQSDKQQENHIYNLSFEDAFDQTHANIKEQQENTVKVLKIPLLDSGEKPKNLR